MGDSIPQWLYVSGNGITKEQIPTASSMEQQLAEYLKENLPLCDFSDFTARNYNVSLTVNRASVDILTNSITATVNANLNMAFGEETASVSTHNTQITSKLGKFYALALNVYNKEKREAFLENFTLDMLHLYAPTTDSEVSCSPKVWLVENISSELKDAFEGNFLFLSPKSKKKYYALDIATDENLRFLYSRDFPTKIYTPSDNGILVAKPIGNQQGLGVLGFCFLPYHFVYDINFPILVQIFDQNEFFQFPINIIIKGNKPRQPLQGTALEITGQSACQYRNIAGTVLTYDSDLNPIEADVQFKCFSESCSIGQTSISGDKAELRALFPQCINGFVIATKEGYTPGEDIVSSNEPFNVGIVLNKLYSLNVNLKGQANNALIYFESDKNNRVVYWPDQKTVDLSEGFYNISVQVYANASITLPETHDYKCVEIPTPGLMGMFGQTDEKCFDLAVPEQKISNAIIGGGKSEEYFIASQLQSAGLIEISVGETQIPASVEDIQNIYQKIEQNKISVEIR
jgi:hypothetical protein